ncbi:MAG: FliM/FliN family flagellar motor switch protein [Candidatus Paracaedimonas acanthamoebae]|uniref:Flagellar motor switch protein FliM n=1 Tax=Candidatus Paracaedimonas acanthamoebae TaxID=244581 RepID=A0A8J7PSM9_9PROT|nr:FliM/FliN family flagellar motor switch protein [Candidatus Paracaedimonas acanthamoebae]
MSSNDVALFSKEWYFSDEWEQFSSEDSITHETLEPQNSQALLNQEEINSLLNHYKSPEKQAYFGVENLLKTKNSSIDDFPFLDSILRDFSQKCLDSWRSILLMNDKLDYFLENKKFVSLKNSIEEFFINGGTKIVKMKQFSSPLLINFNSECTDFLIESILGGCSTLHSAQKNKRPLTKLSTNINLYFLRFLLSALENAFGKFVNYDFFLEEENDPSDLMHLSHLSDNALLVKFIFMVDSSSNTINILFPLTFLEDFKLRLERKNKIKEQQHFTVWQEYLSNHLEQTHLTVEAKLPLIISSLEEILTWKIGTQITLPLTSSSLISVECEDIELMKGEVGQYNNSVAIQITRNKLSSIKEEK